MWLMLAAALVTVKGSVTMDGALPGVTVTLTCGAVTRTGLTDVDGRYAFAGVAEGEQCTARYELNGFKAAEQVITAKADAEVPAQEMKFSAEAITFSCGHTPCSEHPPETQYDLPLCTDYAMNDEWIEAARNGDASVVALLRARYAETQSLREKHRIATALFGRMHDADVWNAVSTEAAICVRWPRVDGELPASFVQWCNERGLPAEEVWWTSFDALMAIIDDRRSRTLLLAAIETDDVDLADTAMWGLALQHDESALPAIERASKKFPERAASLEEIGWPALAPLLEKLDAAAESGPP
jgi:hypothetical protein